MSSCPEIPLTCTPPPPPPPPVQICSISLNAPQPFFDASEYMTRFGLS